MNTRALLVAGAAALAVAAPAFAKGPVHATLSGPGLDGAITVRGTGEPGGVSPLGQLVTEAGFFPAAFGQTPDPMLSGRPEGELGPKYTVTYPMPGPSNRTDVIRQDLYPYAVGGPVSYTKPGQPFYGTQRTRGGWFRGSPTLVDTLVASGLPRTAPSAGGGGSSFWSLSAAETGVLAASMLVLLAAAAIVYLRRRPHPAPAR